MGETPENGASETEQAFIRAYVSRYAAYHHAWSLFFVAHLADMRRHFGDLDDALLLAAFGLGPVADKRRAAQRSRNAEALAFTGRGVSPGTTNATRLAEVTGIPRETVRRKLDRFRTRGWVQQEKDGSWQLGLDATGKVVVAEELAPLQGELLRRLARLLAEFARLEER
jgi:DNA-binding transcriptional ArsR family regulator